MDLRSDSSGELKIDKKLIERAHNLSLEENKMEEYANNAMDHSPGLPSNIDVNLDMDIFQED